MRKKSNKTGPIDTSMSLGDHLEELRARILLSLVGIVPTLILCLVFGRYIIRFVEKPYIDIMGTEARLQSLAPADGFVSYMKICFVSGLILASPWVFYHIWMFVSAGLYEKEKKYVKIAVPFCAFLFISGAMFFIFLIAPLSMKFLITFNKSMLQISSNFTFKHYISFITILMLVFGIGFQTPILIFFLNKLGLVSIKALKSIRQYVFLGVFVVAAVATPPDVISQVMLAVPLYVLYELGIIISYLSQRKKKKISITDRDTQENDDQNQSPQSRNDND